MLRRAHLVLIAVPLLASLVAGCKPENKFVAPPPAQVGVAQPQRQSLLPYLEQTGNTQAFATVDLVARVEGFLTSINYKDGAIVKKGDVLFEIEPTIYAAKVKQAEADLASAKAQLVLTDADLERQGTLLKQSVTAQTTYDQAKAKRDSAAANVDGQTANLAVARANLGYTKVTAPFDGIVTKHLISVGELVGATGATKLATIVQLDPIYVAFSVSEQDVLRFRANVGPQLPTREQLTSVELEIGLMTEEGYPHKGRLDYAAPEIDTSTGTIQLRGLFANPKRELLPGFFARVRVPMAFQPRDVLLVPDRAVAEDQSGRYVLVVNKDDVVEQRRVKPGQLAVGNMRVIESGLTVEDRVVVAGNGRAIPGNKVVPRPAEAAPAAPSK